MTSHAASAPTYSLDELATAAGISRRTVRYYIQIGLLARAEGETRAARYSMGHLEQLVAIRRWTDQGVSLERIRALLAKGTEEAPPPERAPGTVEVWSHIVVANGLEVTLEPSRAGLNPEQVRSFIRLIAQAYEAARKEEE